jgi:hypothetical protein
VTEPKVKEIKVDQSDARSWLEYSLRQGFGLSDAVMATHDLDRGYSFALAPEGSIRMPLDFAVGGVVRQKVAREGPSNLLGQFRGEGAKSVLIEDDLTRRMDPAVRRWDEPLAFLGDRIVHWCDLADNVDDALLPGLRDTRSMGLLRPDQLWILA